jgi:hypothetical protein
MLVAINNAVNIAFMPVSLFGMGVGEVAALVSQL